MKQINSHLLIDPRLLLFLACAQRAIAEAQDGEYVQDSGLEAEEQNQSAGAQLNRKTPGGLARYAAAMYGAGKAIKEAKTAMASHNKGGMTLYSDSDYYKQLFNDRWSLSAGSGSGDSGSKYNTVLVSGKTKIPDPVEAQATVAKEVANFNYLVSERLTPTLGDLPLLDAQYVHEIKYVTDARGVFGPMGGETIEIEPRSSFFGVLFEAQYAVKIYPVNWMTSVDPIIQLRQTLMHEWLHVAFPSLSEYSTHSLTMPFYRRIYEQ